MESFKIGKEEKGKYLKRILRFIGLMPDQKSFTDELVRQIQDINGNPALSPDNKAQAIANLQGATRESMFEYLNKNFRTGPGLAKALSNYVSKGRPKGGPSDSAKGSKKRRLF